MLTEVKSTTVIELLSMNAFIPVVKGSRETVVGADQREPDARNSEAELKRY